MISRPVAVCAHAGRAEVVLHVARALRAGGVDIAFELGEDLLDGLADDVGQDVEPAAMRHADDDLVHARSAARSSISSRIAIAVSRAFEREALLADEARVQEVLELFGRRSRLRRMRMRGVVVERPVVRVRLHALLQPALLLRVLDVHVLAADRAAVGLAQGFEDLAQGRQGFGPPSPIASARLPVKNSRSRSQMVRP